MRIALQLARSTFVRTAYSSAPRSWTAFWSIAAEGSARSSRQLEQSSRLTVEGSARTRTDFASLLERAFHASSKNAFPSGDKKRIAGGTAVSKTQRILPIVLIATFGLALCATKASAVDFASPKSYPVGISPAAIAIADFNGDGKLDIAVANSGSASVSILLGNGDGTFRAPVQILASQFPISVAVGDFNTDQKLDVVIGDQRVETLDVILGKGDGTFPPTQTIS